MNYNPTYSNQPSQHPMSVQVDHRTNKQMFNQHVDAEIVAEKDNTIVQLRETIEILELKIKKLEQLVKLKDAKIQNLSNKMQSAGIL